MFSHLLKNKNHVLLRNEGIKSGVVNNTHANEAIKYGITSTNKRKWRLTKETCMYNCELNKEEKTLSTYDNTDKKNEETMNACEDETVN